MTVVVIFEEKEKRNFLHLCWVITIFLLIRQSSTNVWCCMIMQICVSCPLISVLNGTLKN